MMEDITRHIRQCELCLQFKASPDRAPMENVNATYPMELVHMDYLAIKDTEGEQRCPYFGYNWPFHMMCTSYCH